MIIYTLSKTVSADAPSLFFLLYPCGIDDDTTQLRQISLHNMYRTILCISPIPGGIDYSYCLSSWLWIGFTLFHRIFLEFKKKKTNCDKFIEPTRKNYAAKENF